MNYDGSQHTCGISSLDYTPAGVFGVGLLGVHRVKHISKKLRECNGAAIFGILLNCSAKKVYDLELARQL